MLVRRVKNVDPILDDLQSGGYHPEMAARVRAEVIPEDRMRKLLGSITSTGVADKLFEALLKHEPDVMKDLGVETTNTQGTGMVLYGTNALSLQLHPSRV